MPSKQTANYKLSQWSKDDRVLMDDFNADNAKIDAAIKAVDSRVDGLASSKANQSSLYTISQTLSKKAEIVVGSYKGDGAETRTISMGFTPKAVFLFTTDGYTNYSSTYYGGLAITGSPVTRGNTPFIHPSFIL